MELPRYLRNSMSKATQFVTTIRGLDGSWDTDSTDSNASPPRKSHPSDVSPNFSYPTKASRARSQSRASRSGTISRRSPDNEEPTTNTDLQNAVAMAVQLVEIFNKPTPPEPSVMYIVLQSDELFPHCKTHGVFTDIVDANNQVIELFKQDEDGRDTAYRGKVLPYLTEDGCLRYWRHEISPEGMVWVEKVPVHPKGPSDTLPSWPNEEEMRVLWETSGLERRKAAGWEWLGKAW